MLQLKLKGIHLQKQANEVTERDSHKQFLKFEQEVRIFFCFVLFRRKTNYGCSSNC